MVETGTVAFERLPGFPRLYRDYLSGAPALRAIFPCTPSFESLTAHAGERTRRDRAEEVAAEAARQADALGAPARSRENARALGAPDAVAVVATVTADLFGAPLAALLAPLTACRVADWLAARGFRAVPVAWMEFRGPGAPFRWIDADGALVQKDRNEALRLLDGVRDWDREIADLVRASAGSPNESSALGRLLVALAGELGLVVVSSGEPSWQRLEAPTIERAASERSGLAGQLRAHAERLEQAGYEIHARDSNALRVPTVQASLLHIAAWIGGPPELERMVSALPAFAALDLRPPLVWPSASATLVDARSARILEKYALTLPELYRGPESLLAARVEEWIPRDLGARFDEVVSQAKGWLDALEKALEPGDGPSGGGDAALEEAIAQSRARMLYQIEKLAERAAAGRALRRDVVERHLRLVCRALAPEGSPQETVLGAVYFLLRYSRALVATLYRRIDLEARAHQVIAVGA